MVWLSVANNGGGGVGGGVGGTGWGSHFTVRLALCRRR